MRNATLIILGLAANLVSASEAEPTLRIYSGVSDTVTADRTTVVCVTEPGATATINGQPAHVYKTGSFGAEVELRQGPNVLTVTSTLGGDTARIDRTIVRAPNARKTAVAADEQTRYFADPIYVRTLDGAYLQYGNGDDRLGGSKMGFVDAGIDLKAIGEKAVSTACVWHRTAWPLSPKAVPGRRTASPALSTQGPGR